MSRSPDGLKTRIRISAFMSLRQPHRLNATDVTQLLLPCPRRYRTLASPLLKLFVSAPGGVQVNATLVLAVSSAFMSSKLLPILLRSPTHLQHRPTTQSNLLPWMRSAIPARETDGDTPCTRYLTPTLQSARLSRLSPDTLGRGAGYSHAGPGSEREGVRAGRRA